MYLPYELDPKDTTTYAVIVPVRATGARQIEHIVADLKHATDLARVHHGYVIQLAIVADYR
jgi:hypothetical protein